MSKIILPNIPDVAGRSTLDDPQLRELLMAIKITLEQITGATVEELEELLNKNN
jgi:hypothetical protein